MVIAAEGAAFHLLKKEFPDLKFIHLKGYRVRYSRRKIWFPLKVFIQIPKIIYRIYKERRWLKKTVEQYKIDAVISDNRFGLCYKKIPSVYITHQLLIKTGWSFTEKILLKFNYRLINKFTVCWVPDLEGKVNLAGDLSHPARLPKTPVSYIGPLSRFKKSDEVLKYELCIVLSGPEPQRTVFENIIFQELTGLTKPAILVRGLPLETKIPSVENPLVEIVNHLPSKELNRVLLQSKQVVCRSGYSSIMDLVTLQKTATLVPTPGQTEQEYLADFLHGQRFFYTSNQHNFSLHDAINETESLEKILSVDFKNSLDYVVENFVSELNAINNQDI